MLSFIDNFLDKTTMYRLVVYYLIALLAIACILSVFGILLYNPIALLLSTLFILFVCYVSNTIFSYAFNVAVNAESWLITGLILSLIITPSLLFHVYIFYGWAALLAIASKFILAIGKKHIFNPVAISVALTAFLLGESASWWVGTAPMMPFVLLGGLLVIKKLQREDMVLSFFAAAIAVSLYFGFTLGTDFTTSLTKIFLDSSLFFLGFVMLTEPMTTPPTKRNQILYGALVGLLFSPRLHVLGLSFTPELALLAGNILAYILSPKIKLMLSLSEKRRIQDDNMDFIFPLNKKLNFTPGQYMEWTLPHKNPDSRGNRRYFTIASSPTEDAIRLGIKFYPNGSSFKRALQDLEPGGKIIGGQLAGEFTLPKDANRKLVFIAGGIGITPYRSIIKYLIDTNEKRNVVLLYSNKNITEIMYQDIFDEGVKKFNLKTIYTLTDENSIPNTWKGERGRISAEMVQSKIPDWKERIFYLSGPHVMVASFEKVLKDMGLSPRQIKIDFFPGFV